MFDAALSDESKYKVHRTKYKVLRVRYKVQKVRLCHAITLFFSVLIARVETT